MTPQGAKVIAYLLQTYDAQSEDYIEEPTFKRFQIRGSKCYYPFTSADFDGYFLFEKNDRWLFHDVVVTRMDEFDTNFSFAEYVEKPVWTFLKNAPWGQMAKNFLTGFFTVFGAG